MATECGGGQGGGMLRRPWRRIVAAGMATDCCGGHGDGLLRRAWRRIVAAGMATDCCGEHGDRKGSPLLYAPDARSACIVVPLRSSCKHLTRTHSGPPLISG